MGKVCGMYGERKKHYQVFGGKIFVVRPLGRPKHRWEDNIKIDLRI